jgi:hypothetical protein
MKLPFFLCAAVVGCTGPSDKSAPVDSVTTPPTVTSSPGSQRDVGGSCPHTGRWAICNVEQRLRQAGFVAKRVSGDSTRRAGFSITPIVYTLGHARLEVFIYNDSAVLAREIAAMDTVGPPLVIRSANLAAVYIGDNARQAERLALAITAGAPQPGSPR